MITDAFIIQNMIIETKFRKGIITWYNFDWWLRSICGV